MTIEERPRSPRATEIILEARKLLEEKGAEALTMRNLGARLSIRAASLYEHVSGKADLEQSIIAIGLREHGDALHAALKADDPFDAVIRTYRAWAVAHPHLYRLMTGGSLDRSRADIRAAEEHISIPIREIVGHHPTAGFMLFGWGYGTVLLEINDRFPPVDIDAVWDDSIERLRALIAGNS